MILVTNITLGVVVLDYLSNLPVSSVPDGGHFGEPYDDSLDGGIFGTPYDDDLSGGGI